VRSVRTSRRTNPSNRVSTIERLCPSVRAVLEDRLKTPVHATWTPDETVLITDQANERVIEVNLDKKILFQY
jgi:hypothetical protein